MKRLFVIIPFVLLFALAGCSSDGDTNTNGPSGDELKAPTNLVATVMSCSEIKLEWVDQNDNQVGYRIERTSGITVEWNKVADVAAGVTEYTNTGLTEATLYSYRVKAFITDAESDPSTTVDATTLLRAPEDIEVDEVSSTWIKLIWDDKSHVETGYELERKDSAEGEFTSLTELDADAEAYTDTDIEIGVTYYYRVKAKKDEISSDFSNEISAMAVASPSDLAVSDITASSAIFTWTDNSPDEINFRLERSTDNGRTFSLASLLDPDITSYTDEALSEGLRYSYRVKAVVENGESDFSDIITFRTPPIAPSGFSAAQDENNPVQINLSWTDGSTVETKFEIQRKMENGEFAMLAEPAANSTSYQDMGLASNQTYYYRIAAKIDAAYSLWSEEVSATTTLLTPLAPGDLSGTSLSPTEVELSWTDNSDNESGFVVARSLRRYDGYEDIATVAQNSSGYNDTGLIERTAYYYQVKAFNDEGDSPFSNILRIETLEGPPAAPSGLEATVLNWERIRLNWTDNSDNEDGFQLERSPDGAANWSLIATTGTDTAFHVDLGLTSETSYFYRVRAFNDKGESAYTVVVEATTPRLPPNAPSDLAVIPNMPDVSTINLVLSWEDNSNNENGFKVERQRPASYTWDIIGQVSENESGFMDTTTTFSLTYKYRVKAFNESGNSEPSNIAEYTTPDPPPDAPLDLIAELEGINSIAVSWRPGSNNEAGFEVQRRGPDDNDFRPIGQSGQGEYFFQDTGLQPETWYAYRVAAFNGAGFSPYSNIDSTQTLTPIVLDEDFEGIDVGSRPPTPPWTYTVGASCILEVTDEEAFQSDNSFFFQDSGDANTQAQADFYPVSDGTLELDLKIELGSYFGIAAFRANNVTMALAIFPDSTLQQYTGAYTVVDTLESGDWTHVTIEFSSDNRYNAWWGEEHVVQSSPYLSNGAVTSIWLFTFTGAGSITSGAWVDNVYLEIDLGLEENFSGPLRHPEVKGTVPQELYNLNFLRPDR